MDERIGYCDVKGVNIIIRSEFSVLEYIYIICTVMGVSEYKIQHISLDMGEGLDKIEIKHTQTQYHK